MEAMRICLSTKCVHVIWVEIQMLFSISFDLFDHMMVRACVGLDFQTRRSVMWNATCFVWMDYEFLAAKLATKA
jgi:hypothetical protein